MNKTIYEFCTTLSRPPCTWLDSRSFMIGVLYVVSDFMSHFLVPPPIKIWGRGGTIFYSTWVFNEPFVNGVVQVDFDFLA